MDISILIGNSAIFLPLIFALFLIYARLTLNYVNKKILNWTTSVINLFSLLTFIFLKMFYLNDLAINFKEPLSFDINGYVDKDTEELILRGK